MCPTKWKSGLLFCLLNRAKRICSCNFSFDNEVKLLKSVFLNNGYSNWFFDKVLEHFYVRINDQHNTMTRRMKTALLYQTFENI